MRKNHILYNPISRNGKNVKGLNKLVHKLEKQGELVEVYNLLEITDVTEFIKQVEFDVRFIIVGGDGTLNRLVNEIKNFDIQQDIYMYRAGTGNDFMRSIPGRGKLKNIKKYLFNLPVVTVNDTSRLFLNSAGMGIDALVCDYVNNSTKKKNKWNYFRNTFRALKHSKPFVADIIIDDQVIKEQKVWFVTGMNSKYLGGGMKAVPQARREDKKISVFTAKNLNKFQIIFIFPLIYLGWHTSFKNSVQIFQGHNVEVIFDRPSPVQIDGEVILNVTKIAVHKN